MRQRAFLQSLIGTVLALLVGCEPPPIPTPDSYLPPHKISVVVSTTHLADLTRMIGGEAVEVACLMSPIEKAERAAKPPETTDETGELPKPPPPEQKPWIANPWEWELTAQRAFSLNTASVVILNGLGLEKGVTAEVISNLKSEDVLVGVVGEAIPEKDLIRPGGVDSPPDPCIWNSPSMLLLAVDVIESTLKAAVDPKAAPFFEQRAGMVRDQLRRTAFWMAEKLKSPPEAARAILTSHDTLRYFGREFGIETKALLAADGTPLPIKKEELQAWLDEKGINQITYDASFPIEQLTDITTDHGLIQPKAMHSRWLMRPGTRALGTAEHLDVGTCDGALRGLTRAVERRFGDPRRNKANSIAPSEPTPAKTDVPEKPPVEPDSAQTEEK